MRRRSCASPTNVRALISSVNDDSLTNRGTCAVRDCARSLTTRNANLPSPDSAASAMFWRSAISNFGSARRAIELLASLAARRLLLDPVENLGLFFLDELLAVGQPRIGAARRHIGQLHDACRRRRSSTGTMNKLLSRTNVTCVSLRAQRGLDSLPVVRVTSMRLCATVSMIDDVAAIDAEDAPALGVPLRRWPAAPSAARHRSTAAARRRRGRPPTSTADRLSGSATRSRAPSNRRTSAGCSADCRPARARA